MKMTMEMGWRLGGQQRILAAAVVAAIFGFSSGAFGQVHQVQMGGGMDANPGVGTGGSNQPVPGYVPINGNDIITGNVSGLQYFHGNVGYSSTSTFNGRLGSSNLNNFARQSASGSAGLNGVPLGQVYYLPSSVVSGSQGGVYSSPVISGFDSALVPRGAVSPVATSAQLNSLANSDTGLVPQHAFDRSATAPVVPGSPGAVLSSPLFALRVDDMLKEDALMGENRPGMVGPATMPGQGGAEPPTDDMGKPRQPNRSDTLNQSVTGRTDPRIISQNPEVRTAMVTSGDKGELNQRVDDTYRTLLDDLKKAQGETKGAGGTAVAASSWGGSNTITDIDPLTNRERRITLNNNGATTNPGVINPPGIPGSMTGNTTAPAGQGLDIGPRGPMSVPAQRLDQMPLNQLVAGKQVKPLTTLVQPRTTGETTAVEVLMTQAERMLKMGKYLEAAQNYQTALAQDPGNVLALVGRAHAEIGAGMYQSGAYDLKFAFTRNPQMVAVRYDLKNFIPTERQDAVMKDLAGLSDKTDSGNVASFLLCYLDYQNGKTDALQAELKKWGEREGKDQWQAVAMRAWTASSAGEQK